MDLRFLPTTKKEVDALGWDYIDVIIFTGDAYVDHPSFGTAVIGRILEREGFRVAVVPQPNWRDDLRDFKKLGRPRLFFGVNSGAMDSMVNHYTANKRLRSDDAYTPDAKSSFRPDYAVTVYSNILKGLYPDVPVVIGGIEASLRRVTHYDYWKDTLLPSVLVTSNADYLSYGMGERSIVSLANVLANGASREEIVKIPQICYYQHKALNERSDDSVVLHSYERCVESKRAFVENFNAIELEANKMHPKKIIEPYKDGAVVINPPFQPATESEMDSFFDLPFTKLPHPRYKGKRIPAYDMIKFSINIHHGCFGGCSFCTIAAHQGRFIQSRSNASIIREIEKLTTHFEFKGVISDIGAPSANMFRMGGKNRALCERCQRKSCLFPNRCKNLDCSHRELLKLYSQIEAVKGVKRFYVGSGVRYDLFLNEEGFIDETSYPYLKELVVKHTSGRLKVAPEHTQQSVLDYMYKPPFRLFEVLRKEFEKICQRERLNYQLVPYFISSHPGCRMADMQALCRNPHLKGLYMEQVQDFTPTPMTASSVMYYSGMDIKSFKPIFVEKNQENKKLQKSLLLRASK